MSCGNFWPPKETTPPTPMLTDAEREAVEYFSEWCLGPSERLKRYGDTLRGLLERLSNPPATDRP